MADSKASLGPLETDILRYIGDHHPISVSEVAEHVAETTGHARTTVLTVMVRLLRKGFLTRKTVDGGPTAIPPRSPTKSCFGAW